MTWTNADVENTAAAMTLLRQDTVPVLSELSGATTPLAAKVARVYPLALDAFTAEADWTWAAGGLAQTTAAAKAARRAFAIFLARELALPVTGRAADAQALDGLYNEAIEKAKLADAMTYIASDALANEILGTQAENGEKLHRAVKLYKNAKATVETEAAAEVKKTLGIGASETPDALAQECIRLRKAERFAAVCGLDADFRNLKAQEYQAKIAEWRKVKLAELWKANGNRGGAWAELASGFKGDEAALILAHDVFANRVADIEKEAAAEVRKTLGIGANETLDALAEGCKTALTVWRLAAACGLDADFRNLKAQEYQAKIAEWRRVSLDADAYDAKAASASEIVRRRILAAHNWAFARKKVAFSETKPADAIRIVRITDKSGDVCRWTLAGDKIEADAGAAQTEYTADLPVAEWPGAAAAAYRAAYLAETAEARGQTESKASLETLAAQRLREARAADLNESNGGDELEREVKDILKAEFQAEEVLDEDAEDLPRRISRLAEGARKEVLAARNWNFARTGERVTAVFCAERRYWRISPPPGCVNIIRLLGEGAEEIAYYAVNGEIYAERPAHTAIYTRDVKNTAKWPGVVRRALAYCIIRDLAIPAKEVRLAQGAAGIDGLYRDKLRLAAKSEAQETHPGESIYGTTPYTEAIRGASRHYRTYPQNPFDGRNGEIW